MKNDMQNKKNTKSQKDWVPKDALCKMPTAKLHHPQWPCLTSKPRTAEAEVAESWNGSWWQGVNNRKMTRVIWSLVSSRTAATHNLSSPWSRRAVEKLLRLFCPPYNKQIRELRSLLFLVTRKTLSRDNKLRKISLEKIPKSWNKTCKDGKEERQS